MLGTHSLRVARYSEAIAKLLSLSTEEVAHVRKAAALHDLGKYLVPHAILIKPGPLTAEEVEMVQRHPSDGAALVADVAEPEVVAMIRCHHERLDGSGYPAGLAGEEIPLGARIIAVADSFDAMTSTRPYRAARSPEAAFAELDTQAGVLFEAGLVLCLHEIADGVDVVAARDLREPVVHPPAIGPLLA